MTTRVTVPTSCTPAWPSTEAEGDWARWELEEYIRDEHSTFTWLLEPMMHRAGFAIESAEYSQDGFDARYLLRATSQPPS